MKASEACQATWRRMQRPATWGAVLLFGLVWNLVREAVGGPERAPLDPAAPFLWAFACLVVTPMPWQWSGQAGPLVNPWRGLIQALPWNAAWVALLFLLGLGIGPGFGRGRGPGLRSRPGVSWMAHPVPWIHPRVLLFGLTGLSAATLLGWILAEKERAEAVAGESRRAAAQAQARALQAQMNPHVLFNAISGLSELVREDSAAAEQALVGLADLLRGLLEHGARTTAPLAEERALVKRYLDLEGLRLGRRLQVGWRWEEALEGLEVPPLLLQPLVENAVKHGISPSREGGEIEISLQGEPGVLVLGVANTGLPLGVDAPEGVGLRNLRERLGLLGLPPEAFGLVRDGAWTRATIRLPRPEPNR